MFEIAKKLYDLLADNAYLIAGVGTVGFISIIYFKQREAWLESEMDSRQDLINPSTVYGCAGLADGGNTCNNHGNLQYRSSKPCNYAVWIDRPREYEQLCNFLKSSTARVVVLVGIPQSGRSKLATKAVLEAYPYELTHMDIRNSPFDDVHGLEERFSNKTFDVNDAISSIIRGLAKTLRGELDALEEVTNDNHGGEREASESLNRFKRALRRFKEIVIPADKPHLFFVNHMEAFSSLTRDVVGLRALEYFLLWLINLTRDHRNIRVLLTCSPLFYYDFMMDIPFRDNLHIVGLGDLPKQEAKSAYEKFIASFACQFNSNEHSIPPPPDFEQVYNILGGRLHDLSKFVELYYTTQQKIEDYPDLGATISKFTQVLYPELYGKLMRAQVSSSVLWEKEHVITAWKMLLNAPNHVVPYVEFIEQIPMNIFYSMLRFGLVLFRPQSSGYCDFEICKKMDTVTFRRPLDRIAAKTVLDKMNENSLN